VGDGAIGGADEEVTPGSDFGLKVGGDEGRGAVGEAPGLPAGVADAGKRFQDGQADHVHPKAATDRFLHLGQLEENIGHTHGLPVQPQGLLQARVGNGADAGDGCPAQVYGHPVRLAMGKSSTHTLAGIHGKKTPDL